MVTLTDDFFITLLIVLASISLMLVALRMISSSMQALFAEWLRWLLESIDKNLFVSVLVGAVTAFLVQSGVSTSLMAVSFSSSGLLNLGQLYSFLLGSNLGTVLTTWLFVIPTKNIELYLMCVGLFPMIYGKRFQLAHIGRLVFSIGLLLFAFRLASGTSFAGVSASVSAVIESARQLSPSWILLGFVVTSALVRSSVAMVAAAMALVHLSILTSSSGVAAVVGINLGVTLPLLFSIMGSGYQQKRAGAFNLLVNFFPAMLFAFSFVSFYSLVESMAANFSFWGSTAALLPFAHLLFNILVVVTGIILWVPINRLLALILPEPEVKQMQRLRHFGQLQHMAPSLVVEQIYQEVKKMSAMVETILQLTHEAIERDRSVDQEDVDRVFKYEAVTDNLQKEVEQLVVKLSQVALTEQQSIRLCALHSLTNELESVADNCKTIFYRTQGVPSAKDSGLGELKVTLQDLSLEGLDFYEKFFNDFTGQEKFEGSFGKKDEVLFNERSTQLKSECLQLLQKSDVKGDAGFVFHDVMLALVQVRLHTYNMLQDWKKL